MDGKRDRETAVEHLLRQSLGARSGSAGLGSAEGTVTADCLDAEALAAWVDGALRPGEAASAESHVASCLRCQDMLAILARTMPAVPAEPWWRRGHPLRWLVPLTAGATAVVVWFAIPPNERLVLPERQQVQPTATASADFARPVPQPSAPAPSQQSFRSRANEISTERREADRKDLGANTVPAERREARDEAASPKREAASEGRLDALRQAPRAIASPAPAASGIAGAVAESRLAADVPLVIVSPNPSIRWRILDATSVQFSTNGGSIWEDVSTGVTARLTAGASPFPLVCWLVGQGGTVLLTTDGRRFERKSFPEAVDLNGVLAKDARSASVTAADGRIFSTADGGTTWTR